MRSCIVQSWPHRCIFVRSVERVSGQDWRELIHHLMITECYELGFPVLHDMREADFGTTSEDMLRPGRAAVEPTTPGLVRRVAMVASSDLAFGLMGIVGRLRDREHHQVRAFRTMGEATSWIDRPSFGDALPDDVEDILQGQLANQQTQVVMLKSGSPSKSPCPEHETALPR
ncbi:MAG: hypothetical protein AAGH68_11545 [Pseudomonadota bacterium]